jgi:hypothetical protein
MGQVAQFACHNPETLSRCIGSLRGLATRDGDQAERYVASITTTKGQRMSEPTRAEQVLAGVIESIRTQDESDWLAVDLQRSWTEGDDVFCLVYQQPGALRGMTLGLRRTVEPDWTIDEVLVEVVGSELGEPLGSLFDTLQADEAGVMWWTGNLPEWKQRE